MFDTMSNNYTGGFSQVSGINLIETVEVRIVEIGKYSWHVVCIRYTAIQ